VVNIPQRYTDIALKDNDCAMKRLMKKNLLILYIFFCRSIFEGASKYDILSYLVDAKERGIVQEDSYSYNFVNNGISADDDTKESFNRVCH
jgi:hypothetical protein